MQPTSGLRGNDYLDTWNNGFRTVFYVGAIDERLNEKGYIVPGYTNLPVVSNSFRSGLAILVTGYLGLESSPERPAGIDRLASQMIELISTLKGNTFRDALITSPGYSFQPTCLLLQIRDPLYR